MEKTKFNLDGLKMPTKNEMDKYRSLVTDELLADISIRNFLKKNDLDISFVDKHIALLMQMQEENIPCKNCKGFLKCEKMPKGYTTTILNEDDGWDVGYVKCEKHEEIYPLLSNYIYRDFVDEWLFAMPDSVALNVNTRPVVLKGINVLQSYLANQNTNGLYINGGSGTGKSYIACALTNYLIKEKAVKVAFVNVRNFIADCISTFDNYSKENYVAKQIALLQNVDVLVLDDLGGEKVSEWSTHSVLFEILDYRAQLKKLTFITSMYDIEQLKRLYGNNMKSERFISRLEALTEVVELKGVDLFKKW